MRKLRVIYSFVSLRFFGTMTSMGFIDFLKQRAKIIPLPRWMILLIPCHYLFRGFSYLFDFLFAEICFLYVLHFFYQRQKRTHEKEKKKKSSSSRSSNEA